MRNIQWNWRISLFIHDQNPWWNPRAVKTEYDYVNLFPSLPSLTPFPLRSLTLYLNSALARALEWVSCKHRHSVSRDTRMCLTASWGGITRQVMAGPRTCNLWKISHVYCQANTWKGLAVNIPWTWFEMTAWISDSGRSTALLRLGPKVSELTLV